MALGKALRISEVGSTYARNDEKMVEFTFDRVCEEYGEFENGLKKTYFSLDLRTGYNRRELIVKARHPKPNARIPYMGVGRSSNEDEEPLSFRLMNLQEFGQELYDFLIELYGEDRDIQCQAVVTLPRHVESQIRVAGKVIFYENYK